MQKVELTHDTEDISLVESASVAAAQDEPL
jgi:hypothetical protein